MALSMFCDYFWYKTEHCDDEGELAAEISCGGGDITSDCAFHRGGDDVFEFDIDQ